MHSQNQKKWKEERITMITAIVLFPFVLAPDVLYFFKKEIVGYRVGIARSHLHVQVATSAVLPKGQVPAK